MKRIILSLLFTASLIMSENFEQLAQTHMCQKYPDIYLQCQTEVIEAKLLELEQYMQAYTRLGKEKGCEKINDVTHFLQQASDIVVQGSTTNLRGQFADLLRQLNRVISNNCASRGTAHDIDETCHDLREVLAAWSGEKPVPFYLQEKY